MPRTKADKAYVTFANGFITEATGLTYPENSVEDIDNCDIELRGSVRRRLGLDQERGGFFVGNYDTTSDFGGSDPNVLARSVHLWDNVAGDSSLRFVVFQVGNTLFVRNRSNLIVSSPDVLEDGTAPVLTVGRPFLLPEEAATKKLTSAAGFGRLWLTSQGVYPFYLEYDRDNDVILVRNIDSTEITQEPELVIRDFSGVEDGLDNDDQISTLSREHLYNLLNQGWNSTQISSYRTSQGVYPSNAQQWILGKDADDTFDPALLAKQEFGNGRAPRGRLLLNALNGDRDSNAIHTVAGIESPIDFDGAENAVSRTGWEAVAFYAGRVWFAGDQNAKRPNGVYFSKILTKPSDAAFFAQENDPTSEHFSDLLDTDGGVIPIPEADGIKRLVPFNSGVLVFATNGVWYIRGSDAGFTPSSYGVDKVSTVGIVGPDSIILNDNAVFFWATNSIHALVDEGGFPKLQDIAETKILTFYNSLENGAKITVSGVYDTVSKKAVWFYYQPEDIGLGLDNDFSTARVYNRALILDTRTGAFTKYSFLASQLAGNTFGIIGGFPAVSYVKPTEYEVITETDGELVTTSTGELLLSSIASELVPDSLFNNIKVVVADEGKDALRIAEFNSTRFLDFETMNTVFGAAQYESYVQTHPDTLGDLQRTKQATYVNSFFDKTETKLVVNNLSQTVYDKPSGCIVVGTWDWHIGGAGRKQTAPQQAYRFRKANTEQEAGFDLDNSEGIVYTKLKMRGKGKALSLRYSSEIGKNFILLGYSIPYTANAAGE